MSLKPIIDYVVPEQTEHVARAAFPKGTLCLQIYDQLGTLFQDQDFADVFPHRGQPAYAPFRLALVTVLQHLEGLSDRQAAEAVRGRLDWKYLLCLELDDPGFDHSVLCEFRDRMLGAHIEYRLFERLLEVLKSHGLVKSRLRARTDSTHVVANIRSINRVELVTETLRAALNALATIAPVWVHETIPLDWLERYGPRAQVHRFPRNADNRKRYGEHVGADGNALLDKMYSSQVPHWWRQIPEIETLRRVWVQHFMPIDGGGARWRERDNFPPGAQQISSPYDTQARYCKKRSTTWLGYKVHITESCDDERPNFITHIHTTSAVLGDTEALATIHHRLQQNDVLPDQHLVDSGYVGAKMIIDSRDLYGIDLFGPIRDNHHRQTQVGFDLSRFEVDWKTLRVTCPTGNVSSILRPGRYRQGHEIMFAAFRREDCSVCQHLAQCTSSASRRRTISIKPQPLYEALNYARDRQQTKRFKEQYKKRSGIEGTISQGVRAFGLRRTRYRGYAKTRLQHIAAATAINMVRLGAWSGHGQRYPAHKSAFASAMEPMLA